MAKKYVWVMMGGKTPTMVFTQEKIANNVLELTLKQFAKMKNPNVRVTLHKVELW